ncbi:MAG: serine/threonine-protein kinase, partial [Longimicrobiales bacterium]
MSATRADLVQELFAAALEWPPDQRAAFVATATEDSAVSAEVLSLLDAHERTGRLDSILGRLRTLRPDAPSVSPEELRNRLTSALGDRYRVERVLGRGGMAIVFLAEDLKHHRKVALKILKPELAHDLGTHRFLQEIATAAQLAHPHILPLHDSGEADGFLYYVMPFVEGESLRSRLTRERRIAVDDALRIAREVADALDYAHSRGVIHRDIKPENILLEAGHAVVSDFGIARAMRAAGGEDLAEAAIALGTPAYMSPEQIQGDPGLDGRSDVYSLGCVLYEMLAGVAPFGGTEIEGVLDQHLESTPRAIPNLPDAVMGTVQRALAKSAAERFPTALEFEKALEIRGWTPPPATPPWRRRATVGVAVLAGAALVAPTIVERVRPPVPRAASVIAVLPLTAPASDSALARLGRDLVVTLSANLDGVSEIRAIDALTTLAQTRESGAVPLDEGSRMAGRLGATSVVHGAITRENDEIK